MSRLQTGVWRIGRWNWAYRFRLPGDHAQAGEYVYGCGFPTREVAQATAREVKVRYGIADHSNVPSPVERGTA